MRIVIFSDIHGNSYSFKEIMRSISAESADVKVFCGDICGYYYGQNEIIDILRKEKDLLSVKGNHDDLFVKSMVDEKLREECVKKFGRSYEILPKEISKENLEFLGKLPEKAEISECSLLVCHGSPWNVLDGYVYPDDAIDKFSGVKYRYIALGHTHYPMYREVGEVKVVNPGSCGQPRDYNVPSYMVIDTDKESYEIKRCCYDIEPLKKEIKMHEEVNAYLFEVLERSQK
ncbi:MAG: metallophosphoesterase family protein [Candidatus Aadella gelida]|nr:metallophosphoesterase family protein [Candidatus Aadella gelida]